MSDEFDDHVDKNKQIAEREKRRRDREVQDLKKVLALVEGRRFLWRILTETRVFASCFNMNGAVTNFNEGKRDIGLFIIGDLDANFPNAVAQMRREHASDLKSEGSTNK